MQKTAISNSLQRNSPECLIKEYTKLTAYKVPVEDLALGLFTDLNKGLSHPDAQLRLEVFGRNMITADEGPAILTLVLQQFKSPIVYLLLAAGLLSGLYQEWPDVIAIAVVILINAGTGFFMEWQAIRSMKALQKLTRVSVRVYRDGTLTVIPAEEIVPGDILYLEAGDIVPVDGRLIAASDLLVDEATLTGESMPVEKQVGELQLDTPLADRTNSLFKGTAIRKGNTQMLCTATGMQTELGNIARLLSGTTKSATPLEKKLAVFSRQLLLICLGMVALIIIAGVLYGFPVVEIVRTAIALSVAAIPEGLPVVATLALAKGMLRMAKQHIIVKQLSSVETLGTTTVICTDKTGTLTENDLELVQLELPPSHIWRKQEPITIQSEESYSRLLQVAVLCNTATVANRENSEQKGAGDPLELSLLRFANQHGYSLSNGSAGYVKVREQPFTSETRVMAVEHMTGNTFVITAKGATENLLLFCNEILDGNSARRLTEEDKTTWLSRTNGLAREGLKPLAFAYRETAETQSEVLQDLIFVGIAGFLDPPREDIKEAINQCRTAGIKVVMLTGDHPATAIHIATQLHMTDNLSVIAGSEMNSYDSLDNEERTKWLQTSIFARVTPSQKLDLVRTLQDEREVVAMTGDGVNDAPALKKSDIGVAMGIRGSQVSQEAADMILQDDSFNSLVLAIKQGRIIFDNIRRFIIYLLSCNLSELLVVGIIALLNFPFRLLPLQILLINLITDVLPALALGMTRGDVAVMKRQPKALQAPIISAAKWKAIVLYAVIIAGVSLLSAKIAAATLINANNVLFFTLTFSQLLHVLNMVNANDVFHNNYIVRNRYIWFALIISAGISLLIGNIPLLSTPFGLEKMNRGEWSLVLIGSLSSLFIIRGIKKVGYRMFARQSEM